MGEELGSSRKKDRKILEHVREFMENCVSQY
jgi:hypothetical protein